MDFLIPLLGSALGAAVITSVFGLIKTKQDKVSEQAQWLRNHKVAVYTEYLKQARLIAIHIEEALTLRPQAMEPLREANRQISTTAIRIAAPVKVGLASMLVKEAITALGDKMAFSPTAEQATAFDAARTTFHARLNELEELMRQDLNIRD